MGYAYGICRLQVAGKSVYKFGYVYIYIYIYIIVIKLYDIWGKINQLQTF